MATDLLRRRLIAALSSGGLLAAYPMLAHAARRAPDANAHALLTCWNDSPTRPASFRAGRLDTPSSALELPARGHDIAWHPAAVPGHAAPGPLRADALDALVLVREGAPLASALAQKKRFPGLLAMFARLGEQTGQLPLMLQRAARQLSTEVQRRALQLATILEPLLIVAMGLIVMMIVLAVLLPIIQLNQFVK